MYLNINIGDYVFLLYENTFLILLKLNGNTQSNIRQRLVVIFYVDLVAMRFEGLWLHYVSGSKWIVLLKR
jgi:hypothetical protein